MEDRQFTSSADHVLLFNASKRSKQSFKVNCRLENLSIKVLSSALPPGIRMNYPPISKQEIDITFHYTPVENGVMEEGPEGKTVILRVEYESGEHHGCNFSIRFNFEKVEESTHTECPICNYEFNRMAKTPRVMECGHTLCEECLINLVETNKMLNSRNNSRPLLLACPYDRKPINKSVHEMATNESILDAVDALRQERATKFANTPQIVSDPCFPCYENNKHEAAHWCEDCKEAYCGPCFATAHKPRIMADHKLAPLAEMPMAIPKCVRHPENDAVFICLKLTCGLTLYCSDCVKNGLHKGHKFEKVKQRLTTNLNSLEDLHESHAEAREILQININSVYNSLIQFGKNSVESKGGRQRIQQFYQQQELKAIREYEQWRQQTEKKLKEQHKKFLLENTKAVERSKKIERKLKRKADMHDIRDLLELGNDFCQNMGKIKTFPNLLDSVTSEGKIERTRKVHGSNKRTRDSS